VQNDQVGGSRYDLGGTNYFCFIYWLIKQKDGDRACQPSLLRACWQSSNICFPNTLVCILDRASL